MSDTPRTDAAAKAGTYHSDADFSDVAGKQIVHIDFARQLERELNTAYADIVRLHETVVKLSQALQATANSAEKLAAEQNSNAWWDAQNKL